MGAVNIEEYLEQRQAEIASSQRYLSIKARITSEKIREACRGLPETKLETIAVILEG